MLFIVEFTKALSANWFCDVAAEGIFPFMVDMSVLMSLCATADVLWSLTAFVTYVSEASPEIEGIVGVLIKSL